MSKTDIFITGVGGLGSLTSSRFLGEAATRAGLKVLAGEIHGMAQRGGIVESTVRIGEVWGPIIGDGQADVLLGFEPVETLRAVAKSSRDTLVITNRRPIVPANVSMAGETYPDTDAVIAQIKAHCPRLIDLDATEVAKSAGNAQALGSVLLGVVAGAGALPFETAILEEVILEGVPPRARQVNQKAFAEGVAWGRRAAAAL